MSEAAAITPIAETEDTVTLRRTDYEALLEALEDAEDVAALRAAEAAVERGESELLPIAWSSASRHGDSPLRVWRTHRGMTSRQLAKAAKLAPKLPLQDRERQEAGLLRCDGAPRQGARSSHGGPRSQ